MGIRITIAVLGSLILTSCSRGLDPEQERRDLAGYAQPSCGPADGPAVEIYLGEGSLNVPTPEQWLDSVARFGVPRPDTVPADAAGPAVLRGLIWIGATELAGRRFELTSELPEWGDVSWCNARGCTPVRDGWIRFDDAEGRDLTGAHELRSAEGDVFTGTFRAQWVPRTFLCG